MRLRVDLDADVNVAIGCRITARERSNNRQFANALGAEFALLGSQNANDFP
jgi:hypothetical protein